jgi:hypothetical protein
MSEFWWERGTRETCGRCGSRGPTEAHHWAPRSMFKDADLWPCAYLCRACHMYWHAVMQTPGAPKIETTTASRHDPGEHMRRLDVECEGSRRNAFVRKTWLAVKKKQLEEEWAEIEKRL